MALFCMGFAGDDLQTYFAAKGWLAGISNGQTSEAGAGDKMQTARHCLFEGIAFGNNRVIQR